MKRMCLFFSQSLKLDLNSNFLSLYLLYCFLILLNCSCANFLTELLIWTAARNFFAQKQVTADFKIKTTIIIIINKEC